jgi:cysteine desulfuration protein SufE
MTISEVQQDIVDTFSLFDNKNDQYNYIVELGRELPPLEEAHRIDGNLIKGCQSKVWLHTEWADGRVRYLADSDALIVRGLVGMLVRVLSDRTPEEILSADLFFIKGIGLDQMLSMNRSNGLASMVKQMKLYALAYQAKEQA